MLTNVDLSREVAKAEYKRLKDDADLKLADLQRQVKDLGIPVIIVFEGWSASGKGTLINRLILPLDPRGFGVYSASRANGRGEVLPFPVGVLEKDTDARAFGHLRSELESQGGD
jgi:AMP-polyphosphate phosphotransferase